MERELKFRAWNNIHNRMEKVTTLSLYEAKPKHLWQADDKHNRYDDFPIMQFTGSYAKSGKEIYDGDIVLVKGTKSIGNYKTQIIKVEQGFALKENKTYIVDSKSFLAVLDVIGNIYETAELLNNQPL